MSNLSGIKNEKGKKMKVLSFAFEDGYEALDWLTEKGKETRGGMSAYIVRVLLEDKQNKTGHSTWLNRLDIRKEKKVKTV